METNFKNKNKINRVMHNETNTYTVISNKLIRDERLSVIEKGIMITLLSNDDKKFVFNSVVLQKTSGIPRKKYFDAIKNLRECGYLESKALKGGGVFWIINESPEFRTINKDDLSNSTKKTEQPIIEEEIIEQNESEELIQEVVVEEEQEQVISTINITEDKDEPEELIQALEEEQEEVISTVNIIKDEVVEDGDEDGEDDEDDEEVIQTVKEIKPIQKKVIEEYVKPKEDRRPSLNGIDYAYASGPIDVDVLTRANEFFRDLSEINFEDKFVNIEKEFSKDQMLHLVFQINNIISGYNKEQVSGKLKELAFKK